MTQPLRTAPCPRCQTIVVFGQRSCHHCDLVFAVQPGAPAPDFTALRAALTAAYHQAQAAGNAGLAEAVRASATRLMARAAAATQAPVAPPAPVSTPPAPAMPPEQAVPAAAGTASAEVPGSFAIERTAHAAVEATAGDAIPGFIDSTLFAAHTPDEVQTEAVPGLIDSTLFAAYTPDEVQTEAVPGLERTGQAAVEVAAGPPPEGFIDSTLFGAYAQGDAATDALEGIERTGGTRKRRRKRVVETGRVCRDCGTPMPSTLCPACGGNRAAEEH